MLVRINSCRYACTYVQVLRSTSVRGQARYKGPVRSFRERKERFPVEGRIQFRHPRGLPLSCPRWKKKSCFIILPSILIFFVQIAARTRITPSAPLFGRSRNTVDEGWMYMKTMVKERERESERKDRQVDIGINSRGYIGAR